MKDQYQVQCPACDHEFNVEDAIAKQIKSNLDKSYQEREERLKSDFKDRLRKLDEREANLKSSEEKQDKIISEKLKEREAELHSKLQKKLEDQYEVKLKSLEEENEENLRKIKELNSRERDLLKRERTLKETEENLELSYERKLNNAISSEREKLAKSYEERKAFDLEEKDILIRQLKERIDDMKKKAEQGSMQVQGEAQELVVEALLRDKYPIDHILEVPKGINGADCIQEVRNEFGKVCGRIVYESKRTKNFAHDWLSKLKQDTLKVKGSVSVLVTEAMPEGIEGVGLIDGVWVTDFANLPFLSLSLRFAIQREFNALDHQENKGDKMVMLYDYLTSQEFRMQMHTIIEGFTSMKINIDKQRRSMMANWKKQEKELEKVIESTVHMYGSVRGIAGSSFKQIDELEVEMADDETKLIEQDSAS